MSTVWEFGAQARSNQSHSPGGSLQLRIFVSVCLRESVPEHLEELPPLGHAFIAAAATGAVIACALVARPQARGPQLLAPGSFASARFAAWALLVTVAVPGFAGAPEGVEPIAILSKVVEGIVVLLAFGRRAGEIGWGDRRPR